MIANVKIKNLNKVEANAKAILEHIEAIKLLQKESSWNAISVDVELTEEAASRN